MGVLNCISWQHIGISSYPTQVYPAMALWSSQLNWGWGWIHLSLSLVFNRGKYAVVLLADVTYESINTSTRSTSQYESISNVVI